MHVGAGIGIRVHRLVAGAGQGRIHRILDRDQGRAAIGITVDVRYGKRNRIGGRIGPQVGTVEGGIIQGKGLYAAGIGGAVVDIRRRDAGEAIFVQLNGDVLAHHGRSRGVLHGDDGSAAIGVTGRIRDGQGDGIGPQVRAGEGVGAQAVGERTFAVVEGTVVHVGLVQSDAAGGVQGHRDVLADRYGRHIIHYRYGAGTGRAVAIYVGDGQGHGIAADVGTIKGGLIQGKAGNAAGVRRAVIDIFRANAGISGGIQDHGQVLAKGLGSRVVFHGYGSLTGGFISVGIRECQGNRIGPHVYTTEAVRGYLYACDSSGIRGPQR